MSVFSSHKSHFFTFLFLLFSIISNAQLNQCGFNDSNVSDSAKRVMQMTPVWLKQKQARIATSELYTCRLAIDIDSDTYEFFRKDTIYIKYEVLKMIERVSKIYEKEINTQLIVTQINIWKDAKKDPYRGISDIFKLVSILTSTYPQSSNYDNVIYLPTKYLSGAGGISAEGFSVSPWGVEMTIAHELGHSFGSPHTQNCSWPNGMLDYCYPSEFGCYSEGLAVSKGTIMSYCPSKLTFHPLCQVLMQKYAEKKLVKITIPSDPIFVRNDITLNEQNYLFFDPVVSAENYLYEISSTQDFSLIVGRDYSELNVIKITNLKKNNTYFLRIKALNTLGSSNWSQTVKITLNDTYLSIPTLISPIHNITGIDPWSNLDLTFQPVEGAEQYEVNVASDLNYTFTDSLSQKSIKTNGSTNMITINPRTLNVANQMFYWRVRALHGELKSGWSEIRRVYTNYGQVIISTPFFNYDYSNLPLNFPISLNNYLQNDTKLTVSRNSDFSNPIIEKYVPSSNYQITQSPFFINSLQPNTQYFLKLESINPSKNLVYDMAKGTVGESIMSFTTGTEVSPSSQLALLNSDNKNNFIRRIAKNIIPSLNYVWGVSEEGLIRINSDSLNSKVFTRENTNGQLGQDNLDLMDVDSAGNICRIIIIGKRIKTDAYSFPLRVYALRTFEAKTMKLVSSKEFQLNYNLKGIYKFNANHLIVWDDRTVAKIENGSTTVQLSLSNEYLINQLLTTKKYVWLSLFNLYTRKYEIRRYTLTFKEYINIDTSDALSKPASSLENLTVDSKENLWMSIDKTSVGKFNGYKWTIYNKENSPQLLTYIKNIQLDKFDNAYFLCTNDNKSHKVIKFVNNNFDSLFESKIGSIDFIVDSNGKVWFNNNESSLVVFNNGCPNLPTPSLQSDESVVDSGKKIILEAKGCTNVVWNWQNKEEKRYEYLLLGTNKVETTINSSTTFSARCYNNGCSGNESSITVSVPVNILVNKVNKDSFCVGDTLKVYPKITGEFDINGQLSARFISSDTTKDIQLVNSGSLWYCIINKTFKDGTYWLKLVTNQTKFSSDSMTFTLKPTPSVIISGPSYLCSNSTAKLSPITTMKFVSWVWRMNNYEIVTGSSQLTVLPSNDVYSIQVIYENGCSSTSPNFNVPEKPRPQINIVGEHSFCTNQSISLLASVGKEDNITKYVWQKDNIILASNSALLNINKAGDYRVQVFNEWGCNKTSTTFTIQENPSPNVTVTGDSSFCKNSSATLVANTGKDDNIVKYQWTRDNIILDDNTKQVIFRNAGDYKATITNDLGCQNSSSIFTLVENPLPNVVLLGDTSICKGRIGQLYCIVTSGTAPYTYQWKNELTNNTPIFALTNGGIYNVTVRDAKGCFTTSNTYKVTQYQPPLATVTVNGSTNILSNTSLTISTPFEKGQSYQWLKYTSPIIGATSNIYQATQAGVYSVVVKANGCTTVSDSITVNLVTTVNQENESGVSVFPNPNNGIFTVEMYSPDNNQTEFIITNVLGQILRQKILRIAGKISHQISIIDFPDGIYLLTIRRYDGTSTIKILKR